nr:hypothetical protein [Tanacetum cinerariifolium]
LHRVPGHALAGGSGQLRTLAGGSAVLLVLLRDVQRCDGGGADRGHAAERTSSRVLTGIQSGHGDFRRLHTGHVDVPGTNHW